MAKSRTIQANPVVRSIVRAGIRTGLSDLEIEGNVMSSFDGYSSEQIATLTAQEQQRQEAVRRIESADKRRNVDLARRLKCPPGTNRVRMRITIHWRDPTTGEERVFGDTVETSARGRLADLINTALEKVIDNATRRGYQPPHVSSASTSGRTFYRIEYAECI